MYTNLTINLLGLFTKRKNELCNENETDEK